MPFITEEIWQKLGVDGDTIMLEKYPTSNANLICDETESAFEYIKGIISSLRNIRAERGISPSKEANVVIRTANPKELETLEKNNVFIKKLAKIKEFTFNETVSTPEQSAFKVNGNSEIFMILTGLLDIDLEIKKLNQQLEKTKKNWIK